MFNYLSYLLQHEVNIFLIGVKQYDVGLDTFNFFHYVQYSRNFVNINSFCLKVKKIHL